MLLVIMQPYSSELLSAYFEWHGHYRGIHFQFLGTLANLIVFLMVLPLGEIVLPFSNVISVIQPCMTLTVGGKLKEF